MKPIPKKVILAGDGGVGKTTLLSTKITGSFQFSPKITIGVDFNVVTVDNGSDIKLLVYDLGGQERFQFLHDTYIKGASGAILLYDLTRKKSFENIPWWLKLIKENCGDIPILVAGNKSDLCMEEDLIEYDGRWSKLYEFNLKKEYPGIFKHTIITTKEYRDVDNVFKSLAYKILENEGFAIEQEQASAVSID